MAGHTRPCCTLALPCSCRHRLGACQEAWCAVAACPPTLPPALPTLRCRPPCSPGPCSPVDAGGFWAGAGVARRAHGRAAASAARGQLPWQHHLCLWCAAPLLPGAVQTTWDGMHGCSRLAALGARARLRAHGGASGAAAPSALEPLLLLGLHTQPGKDPLPLPPAVNCHRHEDQSRRDDLWGWFYCLVELVEGEACCACG